jgi:hypothetical protein
MRFRKTAGVLRTAVAMTVTTALAAPAEAATSARDGNRVVADEVGDAAYTLGVLATPVGAVPVGCIHHSWSTWRWLAASSRTIPCAPRESP